VTETRLNGLSHVLLDIEGTTCPVSFVADVLFPFARRQLGTYLEHHGEEAEVAALIRAVHDDCQQRPGEHPVEVVPYLEWLIDNDIKLTPLKDLQGRLWRQGYASGVLEADLFGDVPAALKSWQQQGLVLGVYSSGSVQAQQLLYGHCQAGDLTPLFSHWFDTRSGPKQEGSSYRAIAAAMQTSPAKVLFISDSVAELKAAQRAGMQVLFSDRLGNPQRDAEGFAKISDYSQLLLNHGGEPRT
jgi:enolase-phosphatase E1